MFCHNCGQEIGEGSLFCENCGARIDGAAGPQVLAGLHEKAQHIFAAFRKKTAWVKHVSPTKALGVLVLVGVIFAGYHFYRSYEQTQQTITETARQLEETKAQLNSIASSTAEQLSSQKNELSQKTDQITKLEADLKNAPTVASNVQSQALSSLAPSVVKIICYADASGQTLQIGSGVLYHASFGSPSGYFVETNQHVVQTSDGSPSTCAIAVYPNYKNSSTYLLYKSAGYQTYKSGVDFAYVTPQVTVSQSAGTMADLKKYAKDFSSNTYCKSASIGDHISILGYPGIGGSSLTATDGIISGFEYDSGSRFIKTSAKIEHGNSGGVAIKDSGCILGIPTFVETGSVESIGRILDLNTLFNS